ncbi:MAG: cyclic pyranopterin monophosphate synthase MoaC [Kiritimatiellae bacterium]|nr:cyclic pyranopterin monophosphate synthase MoaC [Kiritimatiellia bacterium]
MSELSHVDESGAARMVDISGKPEVKRTARAEGKIFLQPETVRLIRNQLVRKGDVLAAARIAGIAAAKKTWDLIPLCHTIEIEQVCVDFDVRDDVVAIQATAVCTDKTGIEMEALTAVAVAALTIYDMCKAADKTMRIGEIRLVEKKKEESTVRGGK